MTVSVDTNKTGIASGVFSCTWANKPSSAVTGSLIFVSDVGENGTIFQYTGSRWRAMNGMASLKTLGTAQTGIANSETIALQTLIPAGALQAGDIVRGRLSLTKTGTTDTGTVTVRVGTAGTTGDTAITGLSAFVALAATGVSAGFEFEVRLVSATSAQRLGSTGANLTAYAGSSSVAASAATVITDASANALYVSVGLASSGATNTVGLQAGLIQLITQ